MNTLTPVIRSYALLICVLMAAMVCCELFGEKTDSVLSSTAADILYQKG